MTYKTPNPKSIYCQRVHSERKKTGVKSTIDLTKFIKHTQFRVDMRFKNTKRSVCLGPRLTAAGGRVAVM